VSDTENGSNGTGPTPFREGEPVLLIADDGTVLAAMAGETLRRGRTVVPTSAVIGRSPGDRIRILGIEHTLARPQWTDILRSIERGPQTIMQETIALMVHLAAVSPGATVVEGGTGSGALTLALAALVGPGGSLHTFDISERHLEVARRNLRRAGLHDRVKIHRGPVEDARIRGVDAVLLDLPRPWVALDMAGRALRPGGSLVAHLPTTTQVERLMRTIGGGFTAPRATEAIHRSWVLSRGGTGLRPAFEAPAHAGFLVHTRRI